MRNIVTAQFVTLDGVIQAPGGASEDTDGGFPYGGWTHAYWHDDIGAHFFLDGRRGRSTAEHSSPCRPGIPSVMP